MNDEDKRIRLKISGVLPFLNEKQRRVVAAAEAKSYGRGGMLTITSVTGLSRQTIYRVLKTWNLATPLIESEEPVVAARMYLIRIRNW